MKGNEWPTHETSKNKLMNDISDTLTKMKMEMAVAGQEMLMDMTITAINKVTKVEDLKN